MDDDGVYMLDYFGDGMKAHFTPKNDWKTPAISFATEEWNRFKSEGKVTLAHRYFRLLQYLKRGDDDESKLPS
jgi:hypothetical protein